MTKEELLELINNDTDIKNAIFNTVTSHRDFDNTVADANHNNKRKASSLEASCWV